MKTSAIQHIQSLVGAKSLVKIKLASISVAALSLSGVGAQIASAGLVFDLRATSQNAVPIVGGTKALFVAPGDVLEITMFARVTGVAAGAEAMQSALGKTITTHSGVTGNQSNPVYDALYVPAGNPLPTAQDLNGDTFTDLGTTAVTAVNTTVGNFFPRFTGSPAVDTGGTAITDGKEFNLFKFTYTVISAAVGTASIQFTQQFTGAVLNSATYQIDGVVVSSKNNGLPAGPTGTSVGAPVILTAVPEPSAFGMVLIGALGLVGFRRLGFRRSA